jgi:PglZ domain
MNPLHGYISKQLAERLKRRRVVVWYDGRREFEPFITEVRSVGTAEGGDSPVAVADVSTKLLEYDGSFFSIRAQAEPHAAADQPEPLLIYIPGVDRDRKGSVLMELELAGDCYEPQLKRLARNVLRERYTDGVIDEMLRPEKLAYEDVVALLDQGSGGEAASLLKAIFESARENHELIAAWLACPDKDQTIREKESTGELFKLIENRLGLKFDQSGPLESVRVRATRYVLINEFRDDLSAEPPSTLGIVPLPETSEQLDLVRQVAQALRARYADRYVTVADEIEKEFKLGALAIAPEHLGSVDTFRFEEKVLLTDSRSLVARGQYGAAHAITADRERGFWVQRDVDRQLQWTACQAMVELGQIVTEVGAQLGKMGSDPTAWVAAYASDNGWHRADSAQRNMEALMVRIDEEPESEPALNRVRQVYDELLQKMAVGFTQALQKAGWTVPKTLPQTRIYPELVEKAGTRVAYFLVDALRFEMGVELKNLLAGNEDLALRPALASLPSITPVGMAALLPRAAASFDVVDADGSLASRIEGVSLKDFAARTKFFKARVAAAVDLELSKLLHLSTAKLKTAIGDAKLVVVRSQEIDKFGEMDGDFVARQMMDTVLQNVARAVRKLGALGIDSVVIAADHGYQFTREKDEAFRTDNPGGETIDLHRRCWAGRGGANPPGTIRVSGAELGYDTDLDFIFPTGIGVFRAGGNLAYHHGGISLQEMVIPVLTLRTAVPPKMEGSEGDWGLKGVPEALNNRTFGVTIEHTGLFARVPVAVRPVLMAGGEQVGEAGMALDARFDRDSKTVTIDPGRPASVAMLLSREDCASIRIVVLDPATDAVLVQSEAIPVRLGV